jgi:hypothetical protein
MAERRTIADLDRAIRSLAEHFKDDAVIVIGSQAALVGWPSTPDEMRDTPEIDMYVAHVRQWEEANSGLNGHVEFDEKRIGEIAHDEVSGYFGEGTSFHQTYGFYIDGVSPRTAALPDGWEKRAVFREVKNGEATIIAIAPCVEDLAVSKLRRHADKDIDWIEACIASRGLDLQKVAEGIRNAPAFDEAQKEHALRYVASLTSRKPYRADPAVEAPAFPSDGSYHAFWSDNGLAVFIREYDKASGKFYKLGNPLGPAARTASSETYAMHGVKMSKEKWEQHPEVLSQADAAPVKFGR